MKKYKHEFRAVDQLAPYAGNARTHPRGQIAAICASIAEFGFTNPVLIESSGLILAGHGRVIAAKKSGLTEIPCVVIDGLSEDQRRAYVIADNRIPLSGGWNDERLAAELQALDAAEFDIGLTGLSVDEVREAIGTPQKEGLSDPDSLPDDPPSRVSLGETWCLGAHRLHCGDASGPDAWGALDAVTGKKYVCIWTDPPYGANMPGVENDDFSGADLEALLTGVLAKTYDRLIDGGIIYCCYSTAKPAAVFGAFASVGFRNAASPLAWVKRNIVMSRSDYSSQFETILYAWKSTAAHRWFGGRKESTLRDFDEELPFEPIGKNAWQLRVGGAIYRITGAEVKVEGVASDVFRAWSPRRGQGHPTIKPVSLIGEMLSNSTQRGERVIDPFAGSGSTIMAAERLGRVADAIEISPKYCDLAISRWEKYTGEKASLAP